jgi:hypothetical protein
MVPEPTIRATAVPHKKTRSEPLPPPEGRGVRGQEVSACEPYRARSTV